MATVRMVNAIAISAFAWNLSYAILYPVLQGRVHSHASVPPHLAVRLRP